MHIADTLRSFGFTQTRFDNDVWIRLDESGEMYEYICTHVDDFMIKVKHATLICGDNKCVILNCTMSDSLLKKKHATIAYHKTREAAAAGIVHPIKIMSKHSFADIYTKAVIGKSFWTLYGALTLGSSQD